MDPFSPSPAASARGLIASSYSSVYRGAIAFAFLAMVAARAVAVYGLLSLYRLRARAGLAISWMHAINWSGLRGSIPVALALVLPVTVPSAARLQAIVLGAVFLSLLVQGLTIKTLLRRLGLVERTEEQEEFERSSGLAIAAGAAMRELEALHSKGELSEQLYERLRAHFDAIRTRSLSRLTNLTRDHETVRRLELGRTSVRLLAAQRVALENAMRRGLLGEEVWRELIRDVDAQLVEGEEEGWERLWRERIDE